ncbi:type I polyketide synthase [Actinosynnema sp. NPDC047251]
MIGAGCRFPGGVDSLESLWHLLIEGRETVTEVPLDRWEPGILAGVGPAAVARMRWGCFLDGELGAFEPGFFGISVEEAPWIDPVHRLLLEVLWEACEHAGIPVKELRGSRTGVFAGIYGTDYALRALRPPDEINSYYASTSLHATAVGHAAFTLDLRGPNLVVDTSCSSSLVALHLACQSLRTRESELALAGGAQLMTGPESGLTRVGWGMLSPTGRCHAFDAGADGFVRGEGCGVVVLKRLEDAERDHDRILAVLRGSAVNQNGQGHRMTVPSGIAQEAVFREALRYAGVDAAEVGMVEAHGPGTPAGDPVEFGSTTAVYGQGGGRCALGSIKTNIGHLEPASGIAGLLKAVMSVRHGQVPASLHFAGWNPQIHPEGSGLFVPTETVPWPIEDGPRIAAVSSYGLGGTNAHVVVAEPPQESVPLPARSRVDVTACASRPHVVVLSAGSQGALPSSAARLAHWLDGDGANVRLPDLAHTLAVRRSHSAARLAVVAGSRDELAGHLERYARGETSGDVRDGLAGRGVGPGAVWVFSGQGSQWARMGMGLLGRDEAFTDTIRSLEPLIEEESGLRVSEVLAAPDVVAGFARVQPVLFAVQVALAAMWRAHGVEPAAVIGHSFGEIAASVIAGILTPEDAVRVVCRRSRLTARVAGRGAMASVHLGLDDVEAELAALGEQASEVEVAVIASSSSTVLSGDAGQIAALVRRWEDAGVSAAQIAVDVASHSPQVDEVLDDIRTALADVRPQPARLPFYSTVQSDPRAPISGDVEYWVANLRRPVRFADAVTAAAADGFRMYVEVSPHPLLSFPLQQNLLASGEQHGVVLPTLLKEQDEQRAFARQLAAAHCAGYPVEWQRLYGEGELVDAPATTWQRSTYLVPPPIVLGPGTPLTDGHPLLGSHVHGLDPTDDRHWWRSRPNVASLPWLADHKVEDVQVLPGAGLCEMALAAAREVFQTESVCVSDVEFLRMLPVAADHRAAGDRLAATADPDESGCYRWNLAATDDDENRTVYATAVLRHAEVPRRPPVDLAEQRAKHTRPVDLAEFAERLLKLHRIEHGGVFTALSRVDVCDGDDNGTRSSALAKISLADSAFSRTRGLIWHPAQMDACLQALAILWTRSCELGDGLALPRRVGSLLVHGDTSTGSHCLARLDQADSTGCTGTLWLLDDDGRVVAEAVDVVFSLAGEMTAEQLFDSRLLQVRWSPSPLPDEPPAIRGTWLLVTETAADPNAAVLADLLRENGGTSLVAVVPPSADALDDATTSFLAEPELTGVVVLPGPPGGGGEDLDLATAVQRVGRVALIVRALARRAQGTTPRLWAVTPGAQSVLPDDSVDLSHSGVQGLMRVLSIEHGELCPTSVDVDGDTGPADLLLDLASGSRGDDEIAWRHGVRHRARLAYAPRQAEDRRNRTCEVGVDGYTLFPRRVRDLDSLELVHQERKAPGPGQVEITIGASSLNFRDVLVALGLRSADHGIGFDCAGTVTAVGDEVDPAWLGRRVATVTTDGGAFSSHLVVRADWLVPVPDDLSTLAAAGLTGAYMTAWYGLRHQAGLRPGQTVLIHSAAGGVGLAAVHVARARGATVLATAGTEVKREYLRSLGIATVLDSRSLEFAEGVRKATGGRGVDVVLNSLTGQAQRVGLDLVAPEGSFVEIGKRDIDADARIGLAPFRRNISFHSMDLTLLTDINPDLIARLSAEVAQALAAGEIPALPYADFPVAEAPDVFRRMANAEHIGRLVLTWPTAGTVEAVEPPEQVEVVRGDGSYIVSGGLGGLGLLVARWLTDNGAASIVLCSRSAPGPDARRAIEGMRAAGTRVVTVEGDIAAAGTAERLVARATEGGRRLRGVLHAAAVVEDITMDHFDPPILHRVWEPKVTGAWRLHEATLGHELDWWVGFSSVASLHGSPGQGLYAAASAALDEFCAWRRSRQLPATSVNWGLWGRYGIGAALEQRGFTMIDPVEGVRALDTILRHSRARTGYTPQDIALFVGSRLSSLESTFFADVLGAVGTAVVDDPVLARLCQVDSAPQRQRLLEQHISDHVATVLRLPDNSLSPEHNLAALGLDSLMAQELRARLERSLGLDIPRTVIWTSPTMSALAGQIAANPAAPWATGGSQEDPS